MKATRSLVPTPSALATSRGSRMGVDESEKSPPKEPIWERTPGVKVPLASERMRRTTSLPASMSTPDCL
jgi:hypothetical protein